MEKEKGYVMVFTFKPSQKEREERETASRKYQFECWIPEQIMPGGDVMVFFNDFQDIVKNFRFGIVDYVRDNMRMANPYNRRVF